MDVCAIENKFISILNSVGKKELEPTEGQDRYPDSIKNILASPSAISRQFHYRLSLTREVREAIENKVIIDAGCGHGTLCLLLGLMRAKKVYGIEYLPEVIEQARYIIRSSGLSNIELIQSDIADVDIPPESLDGIFSIEAISHYRNYDLFLERARSWLRPGGFLLVSDGNNGASRTVKRNIKEIWNAFENVPESLVIHTHVKNGPCYVESRRDIILRKYPELTSEQAMQYAKMTAGYTLDSTLLAVGQFIKGDFTLKSEWTPDMCPLDPKTDMYMERLVDPRQLARYLDSIGFSALYKSTGPSSPKMGRLTRLWETMSPLTILSKRGFRVIAFKR